MIIIINIFILGILGIRDLLYKMKLSETPTCRLCNIEPGTLIHIFVECNKVKTFFTQLFDWILAKTAVAVSNDNLTILFGYLLNTSYKNPIHTTHMVAKNYIFQTARHNNSLFLCILKKKILRLYFEQYNLSNFNK